MFRWLKKRCGHLPVRKYYVTSDDYKYGFKVDKPQVSFYNSRMHSSISINNSTEHIYEEVSDVLSSKTRELAYAITSLVEIIDCEFGDSPFNNMCFSEVPENGQYSDNGYESKQSSSDETKSTTSSTYQPITIHPSNVYKLSSDDVCLLLPTRHHLKFHSNKRNTSYKRFVKCRSKCRRWLSKQLSRSCSYSTSKEQLQVSNQKSSRPVPRVTRRRLTLKRGKGIFLINCKDCLEYSSILSDNCKQTALASSHDDICVISGQSSLSDRGNVDGYKRDDGDSDDIEMKASLPENLSYFKPSTGFGFNKWYLRNNIY